jgi:hypothetical protein
MPDLKPDNKQQKPTLHQDYYYTPQGYVVFTAEYLLKRGHCCQSGCRHCPYGFTKKS